ncbi:MAG TPA: phosphotransferase [Mycobacteriales bacterium]|nr:phosphotransferase [Mycobacteriales bacterium]
MTTLEELLAGWLPQQRWYGSKGRPVTGLVAHRGEPLTGAHGRLLPLLVQVTFGDGGPEETYQVPVALRPEPWEDIAHSLLGQVDGEFVYDAPHDPDAAALLLSALHDQTRAGQVSFHRIAEINTDLRPRLVGAEQSNTSLVYGEQLILKLFRRIAPGLNPDLELTRALQAAGSVHVAAVHGWIETEIDGQEATLGVLQAFARSATEGWKLAQASVRDLYAEADLHADEVGGDFAGESHRLGSATADVHALLAQALPTRVADRAEAAATAQQMHDRLDYAAAEIPALAEHAGTLHAAFAQVAGREGVPTQRIHGDYHLGQVLRTDTGWLLLDFEGEPARPLAERTALMSPIRDVAGMLRSFDYAARSLLADHPYEPGLEYRAGEWAERNRTAFCEGYAAVTGRDPREDEVLLRAFELDKAVYEVIYEARHRPSWLSIPLGSIQRLAA